MPSLRPQPRPVVWGHGSGTILVYFSVKFHLTICGSSRFTPGYPSNLMRSQCLKGNESDYIIIDLYNVV